jgi:hypothetical protein
VDSKLGVDQMRVFAGVKTPMTDIPDTKQNIQNVRVFKNMPKACMSKVSGENNGPINI